MTKVVTGVIILDLLEVSMHHKVNGPVAMFLVVAGVATCLVLVACAMTEVLPLMVALKWAAVSLAVGLLADTDMRSIVMDGIRAINGGDVLPQVYQGDRRRR